MLQTLMHFNPRDVPAMVALRNTVAVTLPLAVGVATGHVGIGLAIAAGALNTMFSDQPGPYRLRLLRMLGAAAAAGLSAFAGYALGGHDMLIALTAGVWGVGGGLLVALGPDIGRIGLISMILLVVTSATPRTPLDALGPAALIAGGGVLLMLFALAAWPWQRYRPERMALARLCRDLAEGMRHGVDSAQALPATQALGEVEKILHGRHRARGAGMDALRVVAESIERVRLQALTLDGVGEHSQHAQLNATLARLREYTARTLEAIAAALDAGSEALAASAPLEGFAAAADALERLPATDNAQAQRASSLAIARVQALGGQLRAAARNTDIAGSRGELRLAAREAALPRSLRPRNALSILRANWRLSSAAMRHAIRCGACLMLAMLAARYAGLAHGYWIPMTCVIVLRPDFSGTFRIGVLRVLGTLAGLLLTTALLRFALDADWARLALFAALCFGFRQLVTMHYGIGVMLLTSLIVILLSFDGQSAAATMSARALGTGLGSALALVAYLLWPTWERGRVRSTLAELLDAYRHYFNALLGDDARVRADVRAASRSARSNAQASLDRLRGEPRRVQQPLAFAEDVFANANRFLRAAMLLEAARQHGTGLPTHVAAGAFAASVDSALTRIAQALRDETPVADGIDLRPAQRALASAIDATAADDAQRLYGAAWIDASDRIADILDTLDHLLSAAANR